MIYDQVSLVIKLHSRWHSMRQRCGGRNGYLEKGITVCDEWRGSKGIEPFIRWSLANGFHPDLILDRIDTNRGYSPDNCRWTTWKHNSNNMRSNVVIQYKGANYTLKELSEHKDCKVPYYSVKSRIKDGWTVDETVNTPSRHFNRWNRRTA